MKKVLSILLAILMLLTCIPLGAVSVSAAMSGTSGDCIWTLNDDGHLIISGNGAMDDCGWWNSPWGTEITKITIKEGVTTIGEKAFYDCKYITSVDIPKSVISIGRQAFYRCNELSRVTVPAGVTTIGNSAFYQCRKLTSISIPNSVTSIGETAFSETGLTSVSLGTGVTAIGERAFSYCHDLSTITLGKNVATIGSGVFEGCDKLTTINIPAGVTSIGVGAFSSCDSLTSITVNSANKKYSAKNGVLFNKNKTKLVQYPCGKTGSYKIPGTVSEICAHAFNDCVLTSVIIPDSVVTLGSEAFRGCYKMSSVVIGDGVKVIPYGTFHWCESLEELTIGNSVKTIGSAAFASCNKLKKVDIPQSVTTIEQQAFHGCEIESLNLGNVASIGWAAFSDLKSTSIHIPKSVTNLGNSVFSGENLQSITVDKNNTHYCSENGVLFSKDKTVLIAYPEGRKDAFYTIPNGVKTIDYAAFNECNYLKSIVIPKSVVTIYEWGLMWCDNLKDVYYTGSEKDKNKIEVADCNDTFCSATWHYNYVCKHTYKKVIVKKATPSANGSYQNVCSKCGYTASKTTTIYKASKISLSKTSFTYDGKVKKPTLTVKDSKGNTISKSNYTVTYASGRKNAGTYKVTVKFKGNYSGTKTLTFKINPISASKCKVSLSNTDYTYNGKVQKPSVVVKDSKGNKISSSNYTITYASGRKNVGTYKVTIKFKGKYSGTKTLTFKINPAKTTVKSLTAGKKSLKVAITKKSPQVTGYEIQYATSKSFKSYKTKTLTSYKKTSLTLSGLSAKKTYYVRVRTYKTVNGKNYYSGWSTYKYKKTK